MKLRVIVCIVVISCMAGGLWNCTHTPATRQGELAFGNSEAEKSAKYLREQLIRNPDDVENRMELSRILLQEDMAQEAVIELNKALVSDPERIKAMLLLSLAFQKVQPPNLTKALELLIEASDLEPDNAEVHLNLAQVYEKLENEEESISEFNEAIALSSDPATLVSAHLGLMAIYQERGETERADGEYKAAYEIFPGVKDIIEQAEINRGTTIEYGGEEFRGDGFHPSLEERIRRSIKEIEKLSKGEK